MNIVKKDLDQNNAVVTLHVEKADYAENVEKNLRDLRKKANIPGFRPGMVPMSLLKKMYGKSVMADEINKLIAEKLYDYIRENDLNILGDPLPNETEQPEIDFNTQEEFDFVFDLGLAPDFDIELSKEIKINYYNIAVTDQMIEDRIKSYSQRFGRYEEVETVEENDMLRGEVIELENGEEKQNGLQVSEAILTPAYIADPEQKALFLNAKKGDTVIFNPAKAFGNETELASFLKISKEQAKEITSDFSFKINDITRYFDSEINQELFDKVFGENAVTNEQEFREKVKETIATNLKENSDYRFGIDAKKTLVEKFKNLSFPDAFLKRWLLASNKNLTNEQLESDYPKMIEDLTWQLIKEKLIKKFDIKVNEVDVENYAKEFARAQLAQYGISGADEELISNYAKSLLEKEDTLRNFINRAGDNKVIATIRDSVEVAIKEISPEEFDKLFEEN
ncbi:MAG TPA: trigger factor [Paludibacteraceae bacterium]|nr:trigger factor [Paludibacteraceae bacterium]HQF12172.1 trigger factor [Paludibacteraceae bacterium]